MNPEIRHVAVALSADALMQQWARQEDAQAGSAVVVSTEIAARGRGGVEWRHEDCIAVAVLARPRVLEPTEADLGWLAVGVGAANAMTAMTGEAGRCSWPDVVTRSKAPKADNVEIVTSVSHQLGPGRVQHVILVARMVGASKFQSASSTLVEHLRTSTMMLDEPAALLDAYRERCDSLGQVFSAELRPSGSVRGRAVDVAADGGLVMESPTGMREHVPVSALKRMVGVVEPR